MTSLRSHPVAACLLAGLALALSLPPWGWWFLAPIGFSLVAVAVEGWSWRTRARAGAALGLAIFVPGLWWMFEFHPAAFLVMVLETLFVIGALVAVPPRRGLLLALPAAAVLAESIRSTIPFGGLPMAGVALGQVSGPLAPAARIGGELALLGLAVAAGVTLAAAWRRRWVVAGAAAGAVVLLAVLGAVAPDGGAGPVVRVALVQGGGPRGFRAVDTDPVEVFRAHLAASDGLPTGLDLVLWPEDVIDVERPIGETPEALEVGAVARRVGAPLVGGVVEDSGTARFRNASVVWDRDGRIVDRYDKVHRVPFGEYIPGRALIDKFADLSVIPRDAVAGRGPGVLDTSAGRVGVVISYEVYFADRARAAANAGGRLLLVPTNAASFTTTQVPTTQVAAARLRALETGRDTVQAGPTGYGAVIDNEGQLRARTVLGRREIIERAVTLRSGRTIYTRIGDAGAVSLSVLLLAGAWALDRRSRRDGRGETGRGETGRGETGGGGGDGADGAAEEPG